MVCTKIIQARPARCGFNQRAPVKGDERLEIEAFPFAIQSGEPFRTRRRLPRGPSVDTTSCGFASFDFVHMGTPIAVGMFVVYVGRSIYSKKPVGMCQAYVKHYKGNGLDAIAHIVATSTTQNG